MRRLFTHDGGFLVKFRPLARIFHQRMGGIVRVLSFPQISADRMNVVIKRTRQLIPNASHLFHNRIVIHNQTFPSIPPACTLEGA